METTPEQNLGEAEVKTHEALMAHMDKKLTEQGDISLVHGEALERSDAAYRLDGLLKKQGVNRASRRKIMHNLRKQKKAKSQ